MTQFVTCIAGALSQDDTFTDHIAKKEGASFLADDEGWRKVTRAAAAQIYHEYLVALEKQAWPEATQ